MRPRDSHHASGIPDTPRPPAEKLHADSKRLAREELEQLRRSIAMLKLGSIAIDREDAMRLLRRCRQVSGRRLEQAMLAEHRNDVVRISGFPSTKTPDRPGGQLSRWGGTHRRDCT